MKFKTKLLIVAVCVLTQVIPNFGQQPAATPSPSPAVTELKLTAPLLKDEMERTEIEPRSGQFKMGLRFMRAKYFRPKLDGTEITGHQYQWGYFREALVILQYLELPADHFASSMDERRAQIKRQFDSVFGSLVKKISEKDISLGAVPAVEMDASVQGTPVKFRTFARGSTWYVIMVRPNNTEAAPLIGRLMDSFEFVTK